jgi:hypothetical protein
VSDTLLAALCSALDLVVFERWPNGVLVQVTPSPAWFAEAFGAAVKGSAITLSQAFPYLESFSTDAEAAWQAGRAHPTRSEPFTARAGGEELLLRAAAVTTSGRHLLVIERLAGLADPRGVLQTAREKDLDRERLARRLETLRQPVDAVAHGVAQLRSRLDGPAGEMADALAGAVQRLRAALQQPL